MSVHTSPYGHVRNLIAAFAAMSIFGFAFGMTYPLLSLILEDRGVDPELIGGVVVRAGDLVIDGSVRGRLAELERTIA